MSESEGSAPGSKTLGTIPLKQVRVSRAEMEERAANPMNRLVPYLDLFERLTDAELARLAVVAPEVVAELRKQVVQVCHTLERFVDLLPRLTDEELMRLTGATSKTIRFWRLCQPRPSRAASRNSPTPAPMRPTPPPMRPTPAPVMREEAAVARAIRSRAETAPHPILDDPHEATDPRVGKAERPTPAPSQPRNSSTGTHPTIQLSGTPFPGYDYDSEEPVPEELEVDIPDFTDA